MLYVWCILHAAASKTFAWECSSLAIENTITGVFLDEVPQQHPGIEFAHAHLAAAGALSFPKIQSHNTFDSFHFNCPKKVPKQLNLQVNMWSTHRRRHNRLYLNFVVRETRRKFTPFEIIYFLLQVAYVDIVSKSVTCCGSYLFCTVRGPYLAIHSHLVCVVSSRAADFCWF